MKYLATKFPILDQHCRLYEANSCVGTTITGYYNNHEVE